MWGAERALLEELIIRCDKCSELKNQNKSSHHQGMQFVLRESRNISQLERIDCANKFCRMLCVTGTRYRPQASSWASAASLVRGCDPLPWLPISALENLRTMYGLCVVVGIVLSVCRLLREPNKKVACWLCCYRMLPSSSSPKASACSTRGSYL